MNYLTVAFFFLVSCCQWYCFHNYYFLCFILYDNIFFYLYPNKLKQGKWRGDSLLSVHYCQPWKLLIAIKCDKQTNVWGFKSSRWSTMATFGQQTAKVRHLVETPLNDNTYVSPERETWGAKYQIYNSSDLTNFKNSSAVISRHPETDY